MTIIRRVVRRPGRRRRVVVGRVKGETGKTSPPSQDSASKTTTTTRGCLDSVQGWLAYSTVRFAMPESRGIVHGLPWDTFGVYFSGDIH